MMNAQSGVDVGQIIDLRARHDAAVALADLGKMANLQIGEVEVVVACSRTQANDQSYFRVLGIEPSEMKILVLKSSNHYRADFEPIAGAIIPVEAPGAFTEDSRKTPYRHLREGVRLSGNGPEFKRG